MKLLSKLKLYPGRTALASLGAAGLCAYGYYKLSAGDGGFEETGVLNNFVGSGGDSGKVIVNFEMDGVEKGVEKGVFSSDEPFYDMGENILSGVKNFYEFMFVDRNTPHAGIVEFGGDLAGFFGSFAGSLMAFPGRYLIPVVYGFAIFPEANEFLFGEMGVRDFLKEGLEDGLLVGGAYVTGRLIDKIFHTSDIRMGSNYTRDKTIGKDWW